MERNTFELHVFVEPVRPSPEVIERFRQACERAPVPLKALLLELDFEGRGFLGVLQSSRYVQTETLAQAIEAVQLDAEALRSQGLTVLREKIEAVATTSDCVPLTASDARASDPSRYFELHLLFAAEGGLVTPEHERALEGCARSLRETLGRPVPRSFNAFKTQQRFLNLRAYGVGLEEARNDVERVVAAVEATKRWHRVKVIEEYVCYDTNKALDRGWLEPLEG